MEVCKAYPMVEHMLNMGKDKFYKVHCPGVGQGGLSTREEIDRISGKLIAFMCEANYRF
jgi:hypothetical protein